MTGCCKVTLHHSHACGVPAAPPGSDSTTSGARLRFGHPTPSVAAADLSSVSLRTCHSVTVSQEWLPVAALSLPLDIPSLASCAGLRTYVVLVVAPWGRARQGSMA